MAEKITSYIHVTISAAGRGIRQQTIDVPLLLTYHTVFPEYTRTYSDKSELIADGFTVNDPTYLMAEALLSQDRKVSSFKVGRRDTAFTHASKLTVVATTTTIAITISKGGTTRTYSFTGTGAIIADGGTLKTAIDGDTSGWGSGGTGEFTVVDNGDGTVSIDAVSPANDGELWFYSNLQYVTYDDETPDPDLAADLTALRAVDDDWYAVTLDSQSGAEGDGLLTALASEEKLVLVGCQDYDCEAGTGLAGQAAGDAWTNGGVVYAKYDGAEYAACRALGYSLPWPPGSLDWMFKSYRGLTADDLSTTVIAALKTVYCNMFVQVVRDVGIFQEGVVASGDWIDTVILKHYLTFRIREALWNLLRSSPKIPYTDAGAQAAGAAIESVIETTEANAKAVGSTAFTLLDSDGRSTFNFSFTPAASQAPADRTLRVFRGLTWSCELSSSIHHFYVSGSVV